MPDRGQKPIGGILQIDYSPNGKILRIAAKLTGVAFKEDATWVAYCRELDLSSCGKTRDEAKKSLAEVIEIFFEECIQEGTLDRALAELGWKCRTADNHLVECKELRVPKWMPPAFMLERLGHGSEWQMKMKLSGA